MTVEPLPEDSPLWDMDNVVLTAHLSAPLSDALAGARENFRRTFAASWRTSRSSTCATSGPASECGAIIRQAQT